MGKRKKVKKQHKNKYADITNNIERVNKILSEDIFVPQAELDYHNFGVIDVYQIEIILEEFLLESYSNDLEQVLIITGKGKVVRPKVKKLLSESEYVKKFKQAGYFNGQSGAFEVWIN